MLSSPNSFSQAWEKGSQISKSLSQAWERDLGWGQGLLQEVYWWFSNYNPANFLSGKIHDRKSISRRGIEFNKKTHNEKLFTVNLMALKLHVPTLDNPAVAKAIKETILTTEPDAKVDIDVEQKTVTIEAKASEETFKQLITAAGYEVTES